MQACLQSKDSVPQQQPDKAGTQITLLKAGCLDALLQLVGASSVVLRSQVHLSCPKCMHITASTFPCLTAKCVGDFLFEHGQQVVATLTSTFVTAGAAMCMAACGRQPCLPAAPPRRVCSQLPGHSHLCPSGTSTTPLSVACCACTQMLCTCCQSFIVGLSCRALLYATCYHLNWWVTFDGALACRWYCALCYMVETCESGLAH